MVFRHHVRRGAFPVAQETRRYFFALHDLFGEHGEIRFGVVAAPRLELGAHVRGPVRLAALPTVIMEVFQRPARE